MKAEGLRSMVWGLIGAAMLLGLPLLGVWLMGHDPQEYAEFPPLTHYVEHAAFSWFVFVLMAMGILAVVLPFVIRVMRCWQTVPQASPATHRFPWWGWCGVVFGLVAWVLAWTRFAWFAPWQAFTFSPLWLAFIVTVNALTYRRTGHCILTDRPGFFAALFPVSAIFWWFFEYLNRFVQNWVYEGVEALSATDYVLFATLPFATVLPAVFGVVELLRTYPRLTAGLDRFVVLRTARPRGLALVILLLSGAGLAGIGIWSDYLFPLLWISPLLLIVCIQALRGHPTLFASLPQGDWQDIFRWALAALICGFFWEMWNWHSLARWLYNVPFVGRFPIFEMPVLGYAGYLPFGLQCAVVSLALRDLIDPIDNGVLHSDGECSHMSTRSTRSIRSPGRAAQGAALPPSAPAQSWLPSLAVLGVVLVLAQILPGVFLRLLGAPSAWLASLWMGGPFVADSDGYWILNVRHAVHVTNACNGAGFFALLLALTVPYWHRGLPRMPNSIHRILLILAPLSGAILANTVRIIAVWYAARVTMLLDISMWAGTIHYVSGLLVFFVFLVGYHISMERIHHE